MEVSLKTRRAYAELDEFIEMLDDSDKNKIPSKVREFFKQEKDKNYIKHINRNIPIDKQNLEEDTLALIALLYLRYMCNDENEKARLEKIYEENEKAYIEKNKEKYEPEEVLKRKNENIENVTKEKTNAKKESKALIKHKESIFRRIIKKLQIFISKR